MTERNLLDMVCEIVKTDKDRLEKNEFGKIEVDSFNLNDFWDQFGAAVQALSNEVTKVGFMCGKKPYPQKQELDGMLQDMMQYYNMTKELFLVLPEEVGETVYGAVRRALRDIMAALMAIVTSLHDLTDKGARERLALTGTFWDACNAVESLPKNNLSAVLKVLEEETALATDAKEELETTLRESDSEWTVEERDLATRAMGLVKVAHLCLQRLCKSVQESGSCASAQNNTELDKLAKVVHGVSPALDDFVSELYHPVHTPTALENAGKLVEVLHEVLSSCKESHFTESLAKDMDRLLLFISHNHSKLDPSVNVPSLASLSLN